MTYDEIREKLDLEHIQSAAEWAAARMPSESAAHVTLTPGDGTVYEIVIDHSIVWNWGQSGLPLWPRDYTVCVVGSIGDTYRWAGQPLHPDYVAEKWTRDGNKWTAVVVCEFLNRFSAIRGTGVS